MDSLSDRLKQMTPLQRAVFALQETQAKLEALERRLAEPIALVGMACRFPGGAHDPDTYWQLLCRQADAIRQTPADRWDVDRFYDADPAAPGKMNTRWGGFLDDVDQFDNYFFGISEREAIRIDPQQRMLLELAWEALEDGGLPPGRFRQSRTGVFIGIAFSEYGLMLSSDLEQTDAYVAAGTSLCLAANRLSFVLGLHGPSVALDTACSSSLVALHLACQALRNGECEAALVGGTNLVLSPVGTVNLTKAGFSAADGRVRAFDAAAGGYVRGEGAGVVVLKPLAAAQRDHDRIYAVIRGSAVNQNGASNGVTAPSRAAQEQVLKEAYQRARVSPGAVQFVEAQGTGTRLGDAMEVQALASVLGAGRPAGRRCALGSVKTNIGHLEAASGMASLMKTALVLSKHQIPANLHFQNPSPDIPFAHLPFYVPTQMEAWDDPGGPRVAGVSGFGFGGSNAHVVLEEFVPETAAQPAGPPPAAGRNVLVLSARTEGALQALVARWQEFLSADPPAWNDICFTAAVRRDHHDCRVALVADSAAEARAKLATSAAGRKPFGRSLKVALVYADQPAAWKNLATGLLDAVPELAAACAPFDKALVEVTGSPLAAWLARPDWCSDPRGARPVTLTLQLGLTAWWRSAGLAGDIVVGQGAGELTAACVAGVLTPVEALRLATSATLPATAAAPPVRPATLPLLSTLDGQIHRDGRFEAGHWRCCLTETNTWQAAAAVLQQRQIDVGLEIGPVTLAGKLVAALLPAVGEADGKPDVLATAAGLYRAGADLAWQRLLPAGRCVRLPAYPWQRQRLWAASRKWIQSLLPRAEGQAPAAADPESHAASAAPVSTAPRLRPELTVPFAAPQSAMEVEIAGWWAKALRLDRVGMHDNFFELGGDSLQATLLLNQLQEALGEAVPGHVLFEVQTVGQLADYLRTHCPAQVRQRYPAEFGAAPAAAAHAASGGAAAIPRLERGADADDLLARLDELSDAEVEALLRREQGAAEVPHE